MTSSPGREIFLESDPQGSLACWRGFQPALLPVSGVTVVVLRQAEILGLV